MAGRRARFLRFVLGLVAIAAVAIVAVQVFPLPPLKIAAENRLSETLGRNVTVESARLSLINGASLHLKGMTVREDSSFGDGVFLKAEGVQAGIDASQSLRTRRLAIDSLTLRAAEFSLVRSRDGTWNWTTLGSKEAAAQPATPSVALLAAGIFSEALLSLPSLLNTDDSTDARSLRKLTIENGSVRLIDKSRPSPNEATYKNITLKASLEPNSPGSGRKATGELIVHSEDDGSGADKLNVDLPFELLISSSGMLDVACKIGPGPVETKNLSVGGFAVRGELQADRGKALTAKGQLTGTDIFIGSVNLSEQVSRALHVDQLGDMSPGTRVASLDAAFQIEQGTVNTSILRIHQVDGLGDASAQNGSFRVDSTLTVNYAATITLSPDSTARIKSAGPMIGLLATLLENNAQVSVPVSITGDLRKPDVRVDVSRIF